MQSPKHPAHIQQALDNLDADVRRAVEENFRHYWALGMFEQFLDEGRSMSSPYQGAGDDAIIEALRTWPTLKDQPQLQAARARFEAADEVVSDDFKAGFRLGATCLADFEVDY